MALHNDYETIAVRFQEPVCFIQFMRPEANNTINSQMVLEIGEVLSRCNDNIRVVVLEGNSDDFCLGADFTVVESNFAAEAGHQSAQENKPDLLYDLWLQLQRGAFISIAHVQGKVNAGGVGFVAACDLVIANENAVFSLSELLFGLMPACVIPFLKRRIGVQKTHVMTVTTLCYTAREAHQWGLIDVLDANSGDALRKYILRLRRLSKKAIINYKGYMYALEENPNQAKDLAIEANKIALSDPENIEGIVRYQREGLFPWEVQ